MKKVFMAVVLTAFMGSFTATYAQDGEKKTTKTEKKKSCDKKKCCKKKKTEDEKK